MAADYLVLDLEWNQPVDPAAPQLQNLKTTLNGEIIQIGAVALNAKGKITGTYTWLVRPTFLRQMHYHVRSLTGLTMQKVKKGILFPEANRQLAALCSPETLLLTWGPDDIHILRQNLLLHNLQDWVGEWCDLQRVYAQQMGATGQTSLQSAMEALHIQADRPAHDALNDAWFTALIAQKLDLKLGLEQYRDYVRLQEKRSWPGQTAAKTSPGRENRDGVCPSGRRLPGPPAGPDALSFLQTSLKADFLVQIGQAPVCGHGGLPSARPLYRADSPDPFPPGGKMAGETVDLCSQPGTAGPV